MCRCSRVIQCRREPLGGVGGGPPLLYIPRSLRQVSIYFIPFKKFASLIPFRRPFLIAPLSSSLAAAAAIAPAIDPSPAGRSMDWCSSGILRCVCGEEDASRADAAARLEAMRRCFLDFAGRGWISGALG